MKVDIVQGGRVLRQRTHRGTTYAEVPDVGEYAIRIQNPSHRRRLVVLSVDGVNVVNAEDAGFDGPGYVVRAWDTIEITGYRRGDDRVAAFRFGESEESYAAVTGRGATNVGVIGAAIFDEKVVAVVPKPPIVKEVHHHHHHGPWWGIVPAGFVNPDGQIIGSTTGSWSSESSATFSTCATNSTESVMDSVPVACAAAPAASESDSSSGVRGMGNHGILRSRSTPKRVGTVYGAEKAFHTATTEFTRATPAPAIVTEIRYGTREQLVAWGVPVDDVAPPPSAFPASRSSVPAPPGWNG